MNTVKISITIEVHQGSFRAMCLTRLQTGQTASELVAEAVHERFPELGIRKDEDLVRAAMEVMPADRFQRHQARAALDGMALVDSLRKMMCERHPIKVLPKP